MGSVLLEAFLSYCIWTDEIARFQITSARGLKCVVSWDCSRMMKWRIHYETKFLHLGSISKTLLSTQKLNQRIPGTDYRIHLYYVLRFRSHSQSNPRGIYQLIKDIFSPPVHIFSQWAYPEKVVINVSPLITVTDMLIYSSQQCQAFCRHIGLDPAVL